MVRVATKLIVFREDLYPRFRPNPSTIQTYAENLDQLPPIEVNQHNELIDGYHRWKAHETVGELELDAVVTQTKSDAELSLLSIERNAKHGQQLTQEEKKSLANRLFGSATEQDICRVLAISRRTFARFTQEKARKNEEDIKRRIYDLHLGCQTQHAIASAVGMTQQAVTQRIADFTKNGQLSDSCIFGDFEHDEPDESGRRIYSVWNFPKATNLVRHFGNIPPEIIDNHLHRPLSCRSGFATGRSRGLVAADAREWPPAIEVDHRAGQPCRVV